MPLNNLTEVSRRPNDYLPQKKIMRSKRRKAGSREPINIDVLAENVKLPFASYVDPKSVQNSRRVGVINRTLDKEIDSVQKKYEINKHAFIAKMM